MVKSALSIKKDPTGVSAQLVEIGKLLSPIRDTLENWLHCETFTV